MNTNYNHHFVFTFCFLETEQNKEITALRKRYIIMREQSRISISVMITSSNKYWCQGRSAPADRRCGAPLCLSTYSVQKMAVCKGVMGRSLNIWDTSFALSAYLKINCHLVNMYKSIVSYSISVLFFPENSSEVGSCQLQINNTKWLTTSKSELKKYTE